MILLGDCLERLKELEDNSVDSVCTDPPYGLKFMGKKWDYDVPSVEIWNQVFRVLKPGGHLLSFAGTRTYHRMATNIEESGFEIRDQIQWLYGSGFPKSLDISKAIDKAAGAEREVVGETSYKVNGNVKSGNFGVTSINDPENYASGKITAPATDAAKQWQGWGTALKPSNEPIVLARKPLEKGLTVAQNVLKWGVGGLNIDASRIEIDFNCGGRESGKNTVQKTSGIGFTGNKKDSQETPLYNSQGRWPANLLLGCECEIPLDQSSEITSFNYHAPDCAVRMLDEQTQNLHGAGHARDKGNYSQSGMFGSAETGAGHRIGDSGGASRFFKVIKPDQHDTFASCTNNVNTVETISCPLNQLAGFAQDLAAILEAHEGTHLSESMELSTLGILSALSKCDGINTRMTQSFVEKYLRELKHIVTLNSDPAKLAVIQKLIDITTTIQSHLKSDSFAGLVTSSSMLMNVEAGEVGSASRFRYCAKASKSERNLGMGDAVNNHCTVKPIKLMEYLIKLITPPNGTVLDPFMGSGSTGVAAFRLGYKFIGCEMNQEYVEIAEKRMAHASAEGA